MIEENTGRRGNVKMNYAVDGSVVKFLGRTCTYEGIRWCGLSGSGIAFKVTGTYARIKIVGDDTTAGRVTEGRARIGIYLNGKRVIDRVVTQPEEVITVFDGEKTQSAEIMVVKLSECAMSTVGIAEIQTDGKPDPLPDKKRKIEFIGDSITCGYGVDLEDPETAFRTDTEDVTRAYAYKTAAALDADYSMVSYSGYGIFSGYTESGEPNKAERVPPYYEKVGFSYAKPMGELELSDISWDFGAFCPDLIVVNLGTNDDSYCAGIKEREEAYSSAYAEFLETVRKHNSNAHILAVLGLMGERLCPAMQAAVSLYQEKTGDQNIDTFCLKEQAEEDGRVSSYHPTERSHAKAAEALVAKIKSVMEWT